MKRVHLFPALGVAVLVMSGLAVGLTPSAAAASTATPVRMVVFDCPGLVTVPVTQTSRLPTSAAVPRSLRSAAAQGL